MKRIISAAAAFAAALSLMTGCGSNSSSSNDKGTSSKQLSIVCTIFPEYDWVNQILGSHTDSAEITYLLDNGVDLHSYQPTADDMIKISSCDMFIYVGGESDEWVEDALDDAQNKNMQVVDLMEVMGDSAKEEEVKEGMEAEEEEVKEGMEAEEEEEVEYDEHVWLSLRNAKTLCTEIESRLEIIDPANADDYKANLASYTAELDKLDGEFKSVVDGASTKTVLFGDRFPFRYFADDYGLDYYAAFVGCSAETEASFETVVFLANKVDELGLGTVFTIENSDGKIAQTIIDNTEDKNAQILTLNSLQSVTAADGETYLSVMQENLETLKKALL